MTQDELFKKLIAHCKEYGFIFPSSEIYDGLSAVYDYGQMGVELKNNIKKYWWDAMTKLNENIVGIDAAIFMHPKTWEASGHVGAFNDPLIDNRDSKKRYRADVLLEDFLAAVDADEQRVAKSSVIHRFSSLFGFVFRLNRTTDTAICQDRITLLCRYDRGVHRFYTESRSRQTLKNYLQKGRLSLNQAMNRDIH